MSTVNQTQDNIREHQMNVLSEKMRTFIIFQSALIFMVNISMLQYYVPEEACELDIGNWILIHAVAHVVLSATLVCDWIDSIENHPNILALKNITEALHFGLFIAGNVLVFKSSNCSDLEPELYWLTFAHVMRVYLDLLIVCAQPILIVLCLPCIACLVWRLDDGRAGGTGDQIGAIPTQIYNDECECEVDDCTICMEAFQVEENVKCLPCRHWFHEACVDQWLSVNFTCPLCRLPPTITDDV